MKRFLLFLAVAGCCGNECSAQAVRLQVCGPSESGEFTGRATAVCIGQTESGGSVFLTAKHNFRDAVRGWIKVRGDWHLITTVNEHPTADVASFEVRIAHHRFCLVADKL